MILRRQTTITWLISLFLLAPVAFLAACSGGDQLLLAEFNQNGEAEIFLAGLGNEESEWQSLVEDAQFARVFEAGELATFVPDSSRVVMWYLDGDEVVIEQLKSGDETPTKIFDAKDSTFLFGTIVSDPFMIFLNAAEDFDEFNCYVSLDGGEAERVARARNCFITENGVVSTDINNRDELTLTTISLDGEEEIVWLDDAEDIGRTSWNAALTAVAYVELGRNDGQLMLLEEGEEAVEVGDEFAEFSLVQILPNGKTVLVIARADEDDDEEGIYLNATGDPLLEEEDIRLVGQSDDGEKWLFVADNGRELTLYVYNSDDETLTEVVEDDVVEGIGYVTEDHLLLNAGSEDRLAILSANADGTELVELFDDNDFFVNSQYWLPASDKLVVQLSDEDGQAAVFVTSLDAEDGYFLLEKWDAIRLLAASEDSLIFQAREDAGDDWILYSIPLEENASEIELDDDTEGVFRNAFATADGRSIIYTVIEDGLDDTEIRQVPIDGGERSERLYRDFVLLDVSWEGEPSLQLVR